jgi:hypothetical protein
MNDLTTTERTALIELHDWDELIFGGFYCLHCTPDDPDSLDEPIAWPCPPLRDAGMTDEEAAQIITDFRAAQTVQPSSVVTQYGLRCLDGEVHRLCGDREYAERVAPEMRKLAGDPAAALVQRTVTTSPWTAVAAEAVTQ